MDLFDDYEHNCGYYQSITRAQKRSMTGTRGELVLKQMDPHEAVL